MLEEMCNRYLSPSKRRGTNTTGSDLRLRDAASQQPGVVRYLVRRKATLGKNLGMSEEEADRQKHSLLRKYPRIKEFHKSVEMECRNRPSGGRLRPRRWRYRAFALARAAAAGAGSKQIGRVRLATTSRHSLEAYSGRVSGSS